VSTGNVGGGAGARGANSLITFAGWLPRGTQRPCVRAHARGQRVLHWGAGGTCMLGVAGQPPVVLDGMVPPHGIDERPRHAAGAAQRVGMALAARLVVLTISPGPRAPVPTAQIDVLDKCAQQVAMSSSEREYADHAAVGVHRPHAGGGSNLTGRGEAVAAGAKPKEPRLTKVGRVDTAATGSYRSVGAVCHGVTLGPTVLDRGPALQPGGS
jgi:hypothetical protein